jgi:hypothetical protein
MSDDKTDDIIGLPYCPEPPLTPTERRSRVVRLCYSFMRNLAFHRAGLQGEMQRQLFAPAHRQFWREVHGNFIDICVLDWCKLFAESKGKHHWRRVIDDKEHEHFKADLYRTLGVTVDQFAEVITEIKDYRDKFVAHLDDERTMRFPTLEVAKRSIVFLHARLGQPMTTEQFEERYEQAFREAQSVYEEALARIGNRSAAS